MRVGIVALASLLAAAALAGAQDLDVAEGEKFYRAHCRICHGRNGTGDRGPALDRGEFDRAATDEELDEILGNGIAGTGMPGVVDSARKRRQVIAYLRSLGERDREPPPGDALSGEAIVQGEGGCLACHMVNGRGAPLGPELSAIGRMRAAASLKESLLAPDAHVDRRYWTGRAALRTGERVSGLIVGNDTFSLRLMDDDGNLHAFPKSELASFEIDRRSTMSSYEGVLSAGEVDDVVAYLATLKGRR